MNRRLLLVALGIAACAAVSGRAAPPAPAAAISGEAVFVRHCQACHGAGPDKPGTVALSIRGAPGTPAELARRTDLSAEMVRAVVRGGIANMPPFRKVEISDAELGALAKWLSRPGRRR